MAPEVSAKHLTSETKAKNLTSEAEAEDLTPESKGWLSERRRNNAGSQCSNGKNRRTGTLCLPERPVFERRRREARRRRRRRLSAQGARSFSVARESGECCKLPRRLRVDIWCIFCLNMLYLTRPSIQLYTGLGERCKLPQRVRAEPGRQTTLGAFFV